MKQRDRIKMRPEEIDEFVRGRHTMSVATVGPDGRVHLVAMWYGFLDGAPAFETYQKSQKVVNLRRDPRMTCMVEDGDTYEVLRGVELVGTGEVVEDEDRLLEVARSVVSRYHALSGDEAEAMARILMRKRVAVKVNVEHVVSWDHGKMALPASG